LSPREIGISHSASNSTSTPLYVAFVPSPSSDDNDDDDVIDGDDGTEGEDGNDGDDVDDDREASVGEEMGEEGVICDSLYCARASTVVMQIPCFLARA
jgi:hypothetical protein